MSAGRIALRHWARLLVVAWLWGIPGLAFGRPQVSAGLTTGVAFTESRERNGFFPAYHLGVRADALLLRRSPRDMAFGPYLEVFTAAFVTLEAGGGVAWLVPTGSTGFVFSLGGFGRIGESGGTDWNAGASASAFWGSRSYNFHSTYGLAAGAFAQGRQEFGHGGHPSLIVGIQVDFEYLALPLIALYDAIWH